MKKLIYIAGPLNAKDAASYLGNVRRMNKYAKIIQNMGFDVYVPANNMLYGLINEDMDEQSFIDNGKAILLRSDAMFVCPGWMDSIGTRNEIKLCEKNNIPVYFNRQILELLKKGK